MSNPLTEICHWATGISVWEQVVLRRLLESERFDESSYSSLASLLLGETTQEPVDFSSFEAPVSETRESPILLRVADATNVNALTLNQTLEFSSNLTVIYGQNTAGKSGYSRIFGNACFSRGDKEVLPNLYDPILQNEPQTVKITIASQEGEVTFVHDFRAPLSALAGFYVFDSTCVTNHLSKENALSFSPLGLSILRSLYSILIK